jgi:hypothetical protein
MEIKNLINSNVGKIMISIILGIGIAVMFKTTCLDKNCITFHGPIIPAITEKIQKHGEKCYRYKLKTVPCDNLKEIIEIKNPEVMPLDEKSSIFSYIGM